MNWISILDRLPEMTERYDEATETKVVASDPVLVSIDGESVKYGCFEKEDEHIYFLNVPIIYNTFGDYEYELDEISHWMPLPAPAEIVELEEFVIENGVLTKYNGQGGHVVIPDSVTSIGDEAFLGCQSLTNVTIPDTVISIGNWAFGRCELLESVTIGDNVIVIGHFAFCHCESLKSMDIPDSVMEIGISAFEDCGSLTSVTIGNSLTSITGYAFTRCFSLANITISDSVINIGNSAFFHCHSLSSITIPDSVTSIDHMAFFNCSSLANVTIPNSVTHIGSRVFDNCISLTSVTISDSVISIGSETFSECTSLTNVDLGQNSQLTCISNKLFYHCKLLANINIPKSVNRIGEYAFAGCCSLTSVTIPDSVTTIGKEAFRSCVALQKARMPDSLKDAGENIFMGCPKLNQYVFISYSTKNQEHAEAIRYLLKQEGIQTWMAPYNIPAGKKYAGVINDAIENCSCVLLMLSEYSQESIWVGKEIERAVTYRKPIVSMHLDESQLSSDFKLYLSDRQITPIRTVDISDSNVQKVLDDIQSYIRVFSNSTYDPDQILYKEYGKECLEELLESLIDDIDE